jgi:hypothetical protein
MVEAILLNWYTMVYYLEIRALSLGTENVKNLMKQYHLLSHSMKGMRKDLKNSMICYLQEEISCTLFLNP